jgi:predicted aspartyl protease
VIRTTAVGALFAVLVIGLSGCLGFGGAAASGKTVSAQVLRGADGARLVVMPIQIKGQGPFAFALDTGASKSTVDIALARRLGLTDEGPAGTVQGVAAGTQAEKYRIAGWRVGDVSLPSGDIVAIDLSSSAMSLKGLLGSDVLNHFHVVTIDYQNQSVTFS